MSVRRFRGTLLAVLVVLGGFYASGLDAFHMLTWDEAEYACLGRSVLRGYGFTIGGEPNTQRPPLLPLSAAASFAITGSASDHAAKAAVLAWALVALAVVAGSFARAHDPVTGLLAAALLGCAPGFLDYVPRVLTEVPFLATFTLALGLAYAGVYRNPRLLPWSWALVGVALLIRYTGVLFAPLFALLSVGAWLTGGPEARRRMRSAWFWLSPLATLVVQAPWLVRQQILTGDAVSAIRHAAGQLQAFLPGAHMPWYSYPAFLPEMLSWPVVLLAAAGAAWAIRSRDRLGLHCLGVVAFVLTWFSFYRMKEVRMVTSILPFLAGLAALGVTRVVLPRRGVPRGYAGLIGIVLAFVLGLNLLQARHRWLHTVALGYPAFLDAMAFLRTSTPPDTRVLGEAYAQIAWYSERATGRPPSDPADLPEALERSDWVVAVNFERGQPDYVRALPRLAAGRPGAASVRTFDDGRFVTTLIPADLLRGADGR